MNLYVSDQMVNEALLHMTLERSRTDAAATLQFRLAVLPGKNWSLAVGDPVRLLDESAATVFLGSIHQLERTEHIVVLLAYDLGIHLTRNELFGVYTGTGAEIIRRVARQLELPLGKVDAAPGRHTILTHAGQKAFSVLRQAAGNDRYIRLENGMLFVTREQDDSVPIDPGRVLAYRTRMGLEEMVNRAVVVNTKGAALANVQRGADLAQYGQFQTVRLRSGTDFSDQAASYLRGRSLRCDLSLLGDLKLHCGQRVHVEMCDWGLNGDYPITAVCHSWEHGIFTTELTLEVEYL